MEQMVMGGLDERPLDELSALIASTGFNCVRAPFSLDMIFRPDMPVPDPNASLAANPDLKALAHSPLAIFDRTVASLTNHGLLVVLNNHISKSGWCCTTWDGEGLWYTKEYPEDQWLDAMTFMAARYRNNSLVAGFDLRNEIRKSDLGVPTWGDGNLKTDWSIAAEKGSRRVLAEDPDMLIFISGLDFSQYLCDVPRNPIHLLPGLAGHLAYTVHYYSWDASIGPLAAKIVHGVQLALGVLCGILFFLLLIACVLPRPSDWTQWRIFRLLMCDCRREPRPKVLRPCLLLSLAVLSAGLSLGCALFPARSCENMALDAVRPFMPLFALISGAVSLVFGLRWILESVRYLRCTASTVQNEEPDREAAANRGSPFAMVEPRMAAAALEGQDSPAAALSTDSIGDQERPFGDVEAAVSAQAIADPVKLQVAGDPRHFTVKAPGSRSRAQVVLKSRLFLVVALVASAFGVLLWGWKDIVTYRPFARELDRAWGFLLLDEAGANGTSSPGPAGPVPIWLGEFGTDRDGAYWRNTLRYVREHDVDWAYWAFNGEKRIDVPETYGLFKSKWRAVRQPWKLAALQELSNATGGAMARGGVAAALPP